MKTPEGAVCLTKNLMAAQLTREKPHEASHEGTRSTGLLIVIVLRRPLHPKATPERRCLPADKALSSRRPGRCRSNAGGRLGCRHGPPTRCSATGAAGGAARACPVSERVGNSAGGCPELRPWGVTLRGSEEASRGKGGARCEQDSPDCFRVSCSTPTGACFKTVAKRLQNGYKTVTKIPRTSKTLPQRIGHTTTIPTYITGAAIKNDHGVGWPAQQKAGQKNRATLQ